MSKREKIILIMTLVAVVYGLVDFLILSKKDTIQNTGQLIADTNKNAGEFATSSMAKISKIELQIKQTKWQTLISKIESDWEHDPFMEGVKPETQPASSSPPLLDSPLTYSGYMNVGKISFAVINGIEYKTGETINVFGYKVIKITPKKVVLQKETDQVVVFLKEE